MKLSPGEGVKYNEYWSQACDGADKVGGKEAVAFLGRAEKVSKGQLRRIWDLADHQQAGELDQDEFYIALRLVALAQRGAELSVGGLRNFTGIQLIPKIKPEEKKEEPVITTEGSKTTKDGFSWTVPRHVIARYDTFFKGLDPQNKGAIDGSQGVTFFGKSGLPRPSLKKIWQLADVTRDGMLSLEEFRTAMHLVTSIRNKRLTVTALPDALDPNGPNWLRIEGEVQQQPPSNQSVQSPQMASNPPIIPAHPQSAEATPPMQAMPTVFAMPPPSATPPNLTPSMQAQPNFGTRSVEQTPSPAVIQQPIMAMPPPPMAPLSQAAPRQPDNGEAEKMREALRKEKLEVERARREMEEMKAEMERLRLEKESLAKARVEATSPPMKAISSMSKPIPQVQPPVVQAPPPPPTNAPFGMGMQGTGMGNLPNKQKPQALVAPTPVVQTPVIPAAGNVNNSPFGNQPSVPDVIPATPPRKPMPGAPRDKPINLGFDEDDIWDQPSPKANAKPAPAAVVPPMNNMINDVDGDSSSDDDDFWGTSGLGPKPILGTTPAQNTTKNGTGTNNGFGGSELDDWMF